MIDQRLIKRFHVVGRWLCGCIFAVFLVACQNENQQQEAVQTNVDNVSEGNLDKSSTVRVKGRLSYKKMADLMPDSIALVVIEDISIVDRIAPVLSRKEILLSGNAFPIPFELALDSGVIRKNHRYGIRAKIFNAGGRLVLTSETVNEVILDSKSVDIGTVSLLEVDSVSSALHIELDVTEYRCGNVLAIKKDSAVNNEKISLNIDGADYVLQKVTAASGEKYESNSLEAPHVVFWQKDEQALLRIAEKSFPECRNVSDKDVSTKARFASQEALRLKKQVWVVEDLNRKGVIDNSKITVNFDEGLRVYGRGGCNSYNGSYDIQDDELKIGNVIATQMACAPALNNQEQLFFSVLAKVSKFRFSDTGALLLITESGDEITARDHSE